MRRIQTVTCAICFLVSLYTGTATCDVGPIDIRRVDDAKPSVFISFEDRVSSFENCSGKKQNAYRLRLTNNMTVPINVSVGYYSGSLANLGRDQDGHQLIANGSRASLCYDAEGITGFSSRTRGGAIETEIPQESTAPTVGYNCSCRRVSAARPFNDPGLWLPPKGFIFFDVPQRYLDKELKIYTLFNYPWEFDKGELGFGEPHHQVYFYSTEIPQ